MTQRQLSEGRLKFSFPTATASQYDQWSFYRNQFINRCAAGNKAVDIVYLDDETTWLIEVKDYRHHSRTKVIDLADEIALKVRDTLAGLLAASINANDNEERTCAARLVRTTRFRVVCHLEQPDKHSRLRPRAIEPDKLVQSLRSKLKAIDPHPHVVARDRLRPDMNWQVS